MSEMKLTARVRPGLYRHAKTGNEYLVCGAAMDSSSAPELRGQLMVIYRRRDSDADSNVYVRPLEEFNAGFTLMSPASRVPESCGDKP